MKKNEKFNRIIFQAWFSWFHYWSSGCNLQKSGMQLQKHRQTCFVAVIQPQFLVAKCIIVGLLGNRVQSTRFWTPNNTNTLQPALKMASKKLPKVYQLGDTVAVQRTRRSDKSGLGEMGHGHGEMRMRRLLVIFLTVDDVRWYSSYDQFGNFICSWYSQNWGISWECGTFITKNTE
jgi:hypothetical protein